MSNAALKSEGLGSRVLEESTQNGLIWGFWKRWKGRERGADPFTWGASSTGQEDMCRSGHWKINGKARTITEKYGLQARLSGWRLQDIKYFISLNKLVNKEKGLELILTKNAFNPSSSSTLCSWGRAQGASFIHPAAVYDRLHLISSQGSDIDTHRCPIHRFLHLKV